MGGAISSAADLQGAEKKGIFEFFIKGGKFSIIL